MAEPMNVTGYLKDGDDLELDIRFTFHQSNEGKVARYGALRGQARIMAETIMREFPPSRERSLALTKIEEAVMWANAALSRRE